MERLAAGTRAGGRRAVRIALALAVAIVALAGAFAHTMPSRAEATPPSFEALEACSPVGFHNVRIAWGEVEKALAAPDASADVVEALTAEMRQVYRSDGSMDMHAFESLLTPELREAAGVDCSGVAPPPPVSGTPVSEDRQVYVDQVRQIDAQTVSAFIVLPGMMFQPAPGATPAAVGVANGTPLPGTEVVDAVQFAIFVHQDGEWRIDYITFGLIIFSDVVPRDSTLRASGATWTVTASEVRAHGMPTLPADSELVATPVASAAR